MVTKIEIQGLDHAISRIDDALHKVRHFKSVDIGRGLSEWQTEDLHRHRPFTMRSRRAGRATTKIRPHSLREMQGRKKTAARIRRKRRWVQLLFARRSRRPILRVEMFNELAKKMNALLIEKIHW